MGYASAHKRATTFDIEFADGMNENFVVMSDAFGSADIKKIFKDQH